MIADNRLAEFYAYIDAVKSGDVATCKHVQAAVTRFERDIAVAESEEYPYYFDEEAAEAAIDWFQKYLRHTVGRHSTHRFMLAPWQQFGIGNIHGWKRKEDGTRRFRRVFWTMGRKNGKSTLAAGMAIYAAASEIDPLTGQKEATAQVILAAAKREQADTVTFAEVERMVSSCPGLGAWEKKYQKITFTENEGSISTVGSNKPYDGLNPSLILLDETHAWTETHRGFYDTMLTGGASRSQPLIVCTTTAGDTDSSIWKGEYDYASQVVNGLIQDDRWFCFIFELDPGDEPLDEANWIKANPNIGVSVGIEFLRDQALWATASPLNLNQFTRFHMNRIVSNTEAAFDLDQWDKCEGELTDWKEDSPDAIGIGVDVGARDDLAAYGVVARYPTGECLDDEDRTPIYRYEVRSQSYIADDTARDTTKEPFATWIYEDKIKQRRYPISDMRDDIIEECQTHYVNDVAYDPYNGQILAEELENLGITVASFQQTQAMFNEPIKEFRQAMADGRLKHDGCEVLRWCIKNAAVTQDRQTRWMLDKRSSHGKIDACVAVIMAFRRAMVAPPRAEGNLVTWAGK